MKLMVSSGIKEVKYINDYKNDHLVTELSYESDVKLLKI